MAGRGPQSFKKRQKEQQRKEKQEEKRAKRIQRKQDSPDGIGGPPMETADGEPFSPDDTPRPGMHIETIDTF